MINSEHDLSLTRQAQLLDLSRASLYYRRSSSIPLSIAERGDFGVTIKEDFLYISIKS
jgi:hypothetical protein